jgi:hypothetical protein
MPTLPVPLHFGQVLKPVLSARVIGAFGLAAKGSSLGTLPLPLQTGHLDIIGIANSTSTPTVSLNYNTIYEFMIYSLYRFYWHTA